MELSFANVNNGLNKGISMICYCPTQYEVDAVFRRAIGLYIPEHPDTSAYRINYKYRLLDIQYTTIQFIRWDSSKESWRVFRGVLLIHPLLSMNFTKQRDFNFYDDMQFHNERYLEQWQA
jgi:hypothetical protein